MYKIIYYMLSFVSVISKVWCEPKTDTDSIRPSSSLIQVRKKQALNKKQMYKQPYFVKKAENSTIFFPRYDSSLQFLRYRIVKTDTTDSFQML